MAELCRFVPQNRPFDTIFAHKSTIAERIGMSERTLYRHLVTLQAQHLIDILAQDRKSRNGRFAVSRIRLTRRAAVLLDLIDATEEFAQLVGANDEVEDEGPSSSCVLTLDVEAIQTQRATEADTNSKVIHCTPYDKLADGYTLSVPTITKNQPPQYIENGLPMDLTWLTGNGLSRAGIFKLMDLQKAEANVCPILSQSFLGGSTKCR